jgi:hypothetical protein
MYAIINEDWGKHHSGETLVDVVLATKRFKFDLDKGVMTIVDVGQDSITYTGSYTPKEKANEMAKRAIKILQDWGWTLYKSV